MAQRCCIAECAEATAWAWQPFGPGETRTFMAPGSHYRGFPVLWVCQKHKQRLQAQKEDIALTYRQTPMCYAPAIDRVVQCPF